MVNPCLIRVKFIATVAFTLAIGVVCCRSLRAWKSQVGDRKEQNTLPGLFPLENFSIGQFPIRRFLSGQIGIRFDTRSMKAPHGPKKRNKQGK